MFRKKPLTRLWENGVVLVVDHYRNYPHVLVHLDKVDPEDLKKLLTDPWLQRASKTLVKEDQNRS